MVGPTRARRRSRRIWGCAVDREEMRFQLLRDELKIPGTTIDQAVALSNATMEAFEKARPDYVDPEAMENTIQDRVKEAVRLDRQATRTILIDLLSRRGIQMGMRDVEVIQNVDRYGATLRFSPEAAKAYALEVIP